MGCRAVFVASALMWVTLPFLPLGCGPSEEFDSPHPYRSSVVGASGGDSGADLASVSSAEDQPQRGRDPEYGQMLYGNTCLACHGTRGQGMPNQGVNLRASKFIAACSDEQLVDFLRKGREPRDPASLVGRLMPPRGGNGSLDDTGLGDIVAFLRQLQDQAKQEGETGQPSDADARQAAAR
jgi:cytochrome c